MSHFPSDVYTNEPEPETAEEAALRNPMAFCNWLADMCSSAENVDHHEARHPILTNEAGPEELETPQLVSIIINASPLTKAFRLALTVLVMRYIETKGRYA